MLNKEKHNSTNKFTFSGLADLLLVDRTELMKTIREIKKELMI